MTNLIDRNNLIKHLKTLEHPKVFINNSNKHAEKFRNDRIS